MTETAEIWDAASPTRLPQDGLATGEIVLRGNTIMKGYHKDEAAAAVARPDITWGETPCAFVELKPGAHVTVDELNHFCRRHLSGFKCPKTSTGKIEKYKPRGKAKALSS